MDTAHSSVVKYYNLKAEVFPSATGTAAAKLSGQQMASVYIIKQLRLLDYSPVDGVYTPSSRHLAVVGLQGVH